MNAWPQIKMNEGPRPPFGGKGTKGESRVTDNERGVTEDERRGTREFIAFAGGKT